MSESLTGVTFLAFGNGSPDVFSTFAAMSSHSGSLAVGELFGAAGFITAVVAASMALVKPFQVARKSFVRDVGFFIVAASFSMAFLVDGRLRLWECAVMVGFYVFYVAFVVTWHWWLGRRRRIRLRETAARSHHHIPQTQELETDSVEDDDENTPALERRNLLRRESGADFAALEAAETPAWKLQDVDEDDEARDRYLAELRSNMRVSRPNRGERRNTMTPVRPSLIGALEFRAVLSSLEKKSTVSPSTAINLRRYSDDPLARFAQAEDNQSTISHPELVSISRQDSAGDIGQGSGQDSFGRARAVSADDAHGLRLDTHLLSGLAPGPETAIYSASPLPSDHQRSLSGVSHRSTLSVPTPSPQVLVSPPGSSQPLQAPSLTPVPASAQSRSPDLLAPPSNYFHSPHYQDLPHEHSPSPGGVSPMMKPALEVPKLLLPQSRQSNSPPHSPFPLYTDSPAILSSASSRAPSIRLLEPSISPETVQDSMFARQEYEDEEEEMRMYNWWPYSYLPPPQVILATLFPTVYGWSEKGILDKLLGVVTVPSVFLLAVTLPVVETQEDDMPIPDPGFVMPGNNTRSRAGTHIQLPPDSPFLTARRLTLTGEALPHPHKKFSLSRQNSEPPIMAHPTQDETSSEPKYWNRWLVFVQLFTAPLFVATIFWANLDEEHGVKTLLILILSSLVFSLVCLFILLSTTSPEHPPKYRPLLCFLGFTVAIAWISTIANEVVGVLKAFGVILGISDAILGLTIFAVGNSLGDLVADVTVARLGFPVMALSACFGGPMLNILLGIGIGGLYMTISHGTHSHAKHPGRPIKYKPYDIEVSTTLVISGITLLVTLVGLLIVVPLNGWRMDRRIGWGLIVLWSLSTVGNVIVEVLGYGGDWDLARLR